MNFNHIIPEWKNTGTEPSENLKNSGFAGGMRPPAAVFNWFWAKVRNAITELQTNLSTVDNEVTAVENRVSPLEVQVIQTSTELGNVKALTTAANDRCSYLENDVDNLETRATSLESRATTAESDIDALESRVTTAESDIDTLGNNLATYYTTLTQADETTSRLLNATQTKVNDIEDSLEDYKDLFFVDVKQDSGTLLYTTTVEEVIAAFEAGKQVYLRYGSGSIIEFYAPAVFVTYGSTPAVTYQVENEEMRYVFKQTSTGITATGGRIYTFSGSNGYGGSLLLNDDDNVAEGRWSTAAGCYTSAHGDCAFAAGYETKANAFQTVFGKHNAERTAVSDSSSQAETEALFSIGYGTLSTAANAFTIFANGKCKGSSSYAASGADYPEMYEWLDGNPNNEDRRGLIVTLQGKKVRPANADDTYLLGAVSARGGFIGNNPLEWHKKYLTDVFGERLVQEVTIPESKDEKTGEVIPEHTVKQFVVNPEYDPEKEYVDRELRPEWAIVGLVGQVIVIDDGTCTVDGYCKPSSNGIATAAESGWRVMNRIDETHIEVQIK